MNESNAKLEALITEAENLYLDPETPHWTTEQRRQTAFALLISKHLKSNLIHALNVAAYLFEDLNHREAQADIERHLEDIQESNRREKEIERQKKIEAAFRVEQEAFDKKSNLERLAFLDSIRYRLENEIK